MRSFNQEMEGKQRNGKKRIVRTATFLVIVIILLFVLDTALYPCTFIRNDLHAITSDYHEDIVIGSSHGKMNIDPSVITNITERSMHNMSAGGEYALDSYYLTKLLTEKQKPERIIYEADPGYFMTDKAAGDNELLFVHEFPASFAKAAYFADGMQKSDFRSVLFPWYEYPLSYTLKNWRQTWERKWTRDYDVSYFEGKAQRYHENGYIEKFDVDVSKQKLTKPAFLSAPGLKEHHLRYLKKMIRLCKKEGIDFVAVTTPMPDIMLEQFPEYREAYESFARLFAQEGIDYWNFNTDLYSSGAHDIKYFTDYDGHMNKEGAENFSETLANMLKQRSER